jgi:hypothetical protein
MDVSGTVRVTPSPSGEKPDRSRLERTAEILKESGFDVLKIGRFGVSVRADANAFRNVLGVSPSTDTALCSATEPKNSELRNLIDLVEVTPRPHLY